MQTPRLREVHFANAPPPFNDFELIEEGNALEGVALLECSLADSLEAFVVDDALEGGAAAKCQLFDDLELIGESDTREGGAILE